MRGRASIHPAIAHSFLTISPNLLTAKGFATVLVLGNLVGRSLNPYAIAASSMISHSCNISGRVHGTSTSITSGSEEEGLAESDMRVRSVEISLVDKDRPVAALM
jgi:hypothetical protein